MIKFILKLWQNFKEYIILVLLIIFSLILLTQNHNPGVQKVRAIAFGSFAAVTSVVTDIFSTAKIRKENEELRRVNTELMLQLSKLRKYGIVNKELKGLLNLKDTCSYPLIPASIVSKSLSLTQNSITLNAGKADSVKPGMPVINYQGLVGIVESTSDDYSIVKTLYNIDLKITVKNERSRLNGIMKWNGEELIIVDVPKTYDYEIGDRIITSEVSSIIPVPIPVGIVRQVSRVESAIFNIVKLIPFADLQSVENVFILGLVESKQKKDLELNFYNK